jgi:lysophospholipase L1-like esterase
MKRAVPWLVAAVTTIAFLASFSELQRMRKRFGEVTRHTYHDHQEIRDFMIKAALVGLDQPVVVIGDSITEMARLPEMIGDKPVVNAGIGGATIEDFETIAVPLLNDTKPTLIVVALGANDQASPSIQRNYSALLSRLKRISPNLLAVAVSPAEASRAINTLIESAARGEGVKFFQPSIPNGLTLKDHIHLSAAGYRIWTPALVSAIAHANSPLQ